MTGARARLCPGSRHHAGLAVIWGEKGRKAAHLAVATMQCVCMDGCWGREGRGVQSSCGGQHGACDCEETANWSNCGGKTLGLLSGSCQCLSGLQLVTEASKMCMFFLKKLSLKSCYRILSAWLSSQICMDMLCTLHHCHKYIQQTPNTVSIST